MPASPRLATAVVGAGLMGRWHAYSLARLGIAVSAIVDPDERRGTTLAHSHGAARWYRNLEELLEAGNMDVVHLCTPRELHVHQVRQLLEAGCHILVEKPLAPSAAETAELLELAAARGRVLCPVHQFPFQAGALRLEREMARLGRLHHVDFVACSAGGQGAAEVGRATIAADILPHPLSLLARLLPDSIVALDWQAVSPGPGELRATGTGRDVTVSILISLAGRPTGNGIRLVGDRATAHLDLFHGFLVLEAGPATRWFKLLHPFSLAAMSLVAAGRNLTVRTLGREPAYPGLRELVRRFHAAVAGGRTPVPSDEVLAIARVRDLLLTRAGGFHDEVAVRDR